MYRMRHGSRFMWVGINGLGISLVQEVGELEVMLGPRLILRGIAGLNVCERGWDNCRDACSNRDSILWLKRCLDDWAP